MDHETHLAHLRADIDRILATPAEALDAPVDACPGWTVSDLLGHHSKVFSFATAQLHAAPGSEIVPFDPPPHGPPLEVFAGAAERLLVAFTTADPGEHRPNWAGAPTAAFWWRRMAQETAVHRWDVQAASRDAEPIEVALAVDGVDELAHTFLAFAERRGITGAGETVHLHATDPEVADGAVPGGEWTFTFHEHGVGVSAEHGKADMAVRGPASDLLLFVWNRRPIEVQTFGDVDPLEWWAERVRI